MWFHVVFFMLSLDMFQFSSSVVSASSCWAPSTPLPRGSMPTRITEELAFGLALCCVLACFTDGSFCRVWSAVSTAVRL